MHDKCKSQNSANDAVIRRGRPRRREQLDHLTPASRHPTREEAFTTSLCQGCPRPEVSHSHINIIVIRIRVLCHQHHHPSTKLNSTLADKCPAIASHPALAKPPQHITATPRLVCLVPKCLVRAPSKPVSEPPGAVHCGDPLFQLEPACRCSQVGVRHFRGRTNLASRDRRPP